MRRARWRLRCFPECARPTGGSHGRTTRGPAQRRGGTLVLVVEVLAVGLRYSGGVHSVPPFSVGRAPGYISNTCGATLGCHGRTTRGPALRKGPRERKK